MADTHEEQLLSDLLADIAREDGALDASHLEARVLASVAAEEEPRRATRRAWTLVPFAAAAMVIIGAAVSVVRVKPDAGEVRVEPGTTTEVQVRPDNINEVRLKPDTTKEAPYTTKEALDTTKEALDTTHEAQPKPGDTSEARLKPRPATDATAAKTGAPIEFVPLLPFTEQELTGSFQIVRVQMPSASLGALRPPLAQPHDIVEADVLLGEDGRARAIRLNTNGSIYPWRSR
jgi:hypothetical protein